MTYVPNYFVEICLTHAGVSRSINKACSGRRPVCQQPVNHRENTELEGLQEAAPLVLH